MELQTTKTPISSDPNPETPKITSLLNPKIFINVAFISLQKGIEDLLCKIPLNWTATKICSFYIKFHKSYVIQNGEYSANFIISGKKFQDDNILSDFIPKSHKIENIEPQIPPEKSKKKTIFPNKKKKMN